MDIQALLRALAGNQQGGGLGYSGGDYGDNNNQMGSIGGGPLIGASPFDANPNYSQTIQQYFNQHPQAGVQPFTSPGVNAPLNQPAQPGTAGNNAQRAYAGATSFMPTDHNSKMQSLLRALQG